MRAPSPVGPRRRVGDKATSRPRDPRFLKLAIKRNRNGKRKTRASTDWRIFRMLGGVFSCLTARAGPALFRRRRSETQFDRSNGRLGAVGDLELRDDVLDVNLDRPRATGKGARDLAIGQPKRHKL